MKDETYVPAEQTQATKKIWVPSPHENSGRPQGSQPPQTRRTENPISLDQRFPKELRLQNRRDYQRISREGQRAVGQYICIDVRRGRNQRLGITASGKYGCSPERNRFKRLVREAFRTSRSQLPLNLEINVVPRQKAKEARFSDIQGELLKLLC